MPELQAAECSSADATIRCERLNWFPSEIDAEGMSFQLTSTEAYLYWREVGTFLVRNGNEIIVDTVPGVEEQIIRLPLLGVVLAVLLQQRGHLVLHASSVAVAGRAAVFLGAKGQGKSTLAATLYARGHGLLTDDLMALDVVGAKQPLVLPGFPQLKLWPDAAVSSLGDDPALLPRLASGFDKRARRVAEQFSRYAVPLAGIFVLGVGPELCLQQLQPQQAFMQLLTNTYVARFGNQVLQGATAAEHLRLCTTLVNSIPIFLLSRPRSLELLPAIAQLVEDQILASI